MRESEEMKADMNYEVSNIYKYYWNIVLNILLTTQYNSNDLTI